MGTRNYTIRGNPEEMVRALRSAIPFGASLSGDSSHGSISVIMSGKIVDYWRTGTALKVTVYRGAGGKSEAEIWTIIEDGLRGYV